jgi:formate/nitrite transporter FocA (FNT family)
MFFIPLGIFLNQQWDRCEKGLTWGDFFINNLLPVTFGNLLGAMFMVAFMYSLSYGRSGKIVAHYWNKATTKSS